MAALRRAPITKPFAWPPKNTVAQAPKVAIFERPASADRPRRAWLPWAIAGVVSVAWGLYYFWVR
jgi:hypothetical protein